MIKATLTRIKDDGRSTLGELVIGSRKFFTLEPTWKDNERSVSCIPAGEYLCKPHGWHGGTRFQRVWELQETEPREAILIHAGNTANDTHGCILVGMKPEKWYGDNQAVSRSVEALNNIRRIIGETILSLL